MCGAFSFVVPFQLKHDIKEQYNVHKARSVT